jgi:hypothetical protein
MTSYKILDMLIGIKTVGEAVLTCSLFILPEKASTDHFKI